MNNDLQIYQVENGGIRLNLDIEKETIWANHYQIPDIFLVEKSVIPKYINNVYKDGEKDKKSISVKIVQIQKESKRLVKKRIEYYSSYEVLEIIEAFSSTWFNLENFDKGNLLVEEKVWFNFREKISPETLTSLALLVAQSPPTEK